MKITPIHPYLGARVEAVDVAGPLAAAAFQEIFDAPRPGRASTPRASASSRTVNRVASSSAAGRSPGRLAHHHDRPRERCGSVLPMEGRR
jgi:hypothetical protein